MTGGSYLFDYICLGDAGYDAGCDVWEPWDMHLTVVTTQ